MRVSVCIATYNGEQYLQRQVDSVLSQIGADDEIVISDDSSTDSTIHILEQYKDNRIKVFDQQTFHSPVFNFENAIKHTTGDIIFLADQDDKWMDGRVAKAVSLHEKGLDLVICNARAVYKDHIQNYDYDPFARPYWQNLIKPMFVGCCMSFKRDILDMVLPFPKSIAMHDLWIGLLSQRNYRCIYIEEPLIEYNRHETSFVAKHPMSTMKRVQYRLNMLWQVMKREKEVKK